MGRSPTIASTVQDALRAATISEDGLTLTLAGQLDRATYQATAKAIETLGGKWSRKAKAHLFSSDVRTILTGILDGDRLPQLPKKNPLAFFATPYPLVHLLLNIAGDVRGVRVLEPSAGDGAIADELLDAGAQVDVLELDDTRHAHLVAAGYQPVGRDFLAFTPTERYPVVVMNPPFTAEGDAQAYITHIEHAWTTCLAPGGQLVAIAPSGFTYRQDKRATAFRALAEQHGEWADNDANAFRASGTGVQTVTLYLRKPAQEAVMTAAIEQPAKTRKSKNRKAVEAELAPAEAPVYGPVDKSICPETGTEYRLGDWVGYAIGGKEMTGQILTMETQAPPFETVVKVPNHQKAGQLWTKTLSELQPAQAPDADSPFPVSEAEIDAAMSAQIDAALEGELTPGTLGLHSVLLAQLVRSSCNVRRHYDPAAIEELAASLRAEGQIENATGRWNADGQIEIVAGESRRRAQVLREEAGEAGLTLLVNVRELDDAEALAISATENMRRRSMTGLEECEAMMRLQDAGRSVEDLAAMFGYKSLQPVADRVLVARNLHTAGRDALDSGELSLAKAFVVARAAGEDVQRGLVSYAQHRSAAALAQLLTTGQFLVKLAGFNVEKSGLAVKRDMFDTYEPFFEDKAKAQELHLHN